MDDVNKNIPLSTPCPSFFQEEEKENITVICQGEEAVQNITREERDAVETMVNLTNKTIISAVEEEEEESEEESEHENELTTTPSPVPVALPSPLPTPTVVELSPPPPQLPSIPSPLNTNLLAQHQPVIISNNNPFPTQHIFSPSDFPPPPTQEIEEIFYNQSIPPPPPNVIANKNDCYTKNNRSGGKNVNFMRQLYEKEEMKINNDEDDEDDDDEVKKVKSELRQTTKNNRRFHRTLFLKKKECYVRQFPILSQKNADLVVCAENKFKEIARIYMLEHLGAHIWLCG